MKSSPAQRLLNRRARTLLPTTAKLLQPQSIDSGTTVEKLAERKRQQAKYYNRGAVDLNPLDEEYEVRIKPFRLGRMGGSGGQMSPSKEMGSNEARTEMTCLPAAEDNGAVRRSGRARKPPSYLKDFVLK
ncbi:Hypothetical predicted protein [Paramuricea clavata]|uniref:Uncharacterized protein n=1 Tax=Paramuricea clavata TaxID=317549 RepID=A0A7D9JHH0_PARCT|nr:Hypothetical predicted protein [Paramuricea clavata]